MNGNNGEQRGLALQGMARPGRAGQGGARLTLTTRQACKRFKSAVVKSLKGEMLQGGARPGGARQGPAWRGLAWQGGARQGYFFLLYNRSFLI